MTAPTHKGVVAAGHALTAEVGADVLREGGTAVDAAIAALAMACLCEPVLCSPGGGGFAMLRDRASGALSLIDFFPQTPVEHRDPGPGGVKEIFADFGTATQAFHIGPATTATPGFFDGIQALHAAGGSMPLDELFRPAVNAARAGVSISPFQHFLATVVKPILTANAETAGLFAPNGDVLPTGAHFRNPALADALEILARDGFGRSDIGAAVLARQRTEGHLVAADFAAYRAIEREPISVSLAGSTVHMNPLPAASGILIAHSLRHLRSPDPAGLAEAFLATSHARHEANGDLASLDPATVRQRGTTHVSVIDAAGAACAVTTSNGSGNGELVGDFGFMLNNILGEEDVNPAGAMGWPANTRLSSMMCPTLIETADGGLIALGSGGSNRIRTAICQVIVQLCLNAEDLETAVTAPRLHVEGGHLDFEDLYDGRRRDELVALFPDHRAWPEPNMFFGGVHTVSRAPDGTFMGFGDARRDGTAIVVR